MYTLSMIALDNKKYRGEVTEVKANSLQELMMTADMAMDNLSYAMISEPGEKADGLVASRAYAKGGEWRRF